MAIDRLRSPYNNLLTVTGDVGPSALSTVQTGGVTPYTFIGDGATNTIVGVTYKVHRFDYVTGASHNITFSRAGNIDILMAAGGGPGGGGYSSGTYAGGGGGAGGLILMYSYGVTATTYSLTVGKGGWESTNPLLGNYYYINAATNAGNSVFGALTAIRGGAGATGYSSGYDAQAGGSGGGAGSASDTAGSYLGGAGTPGQGFAGGSTATTSRSNTPYYGGGGGSCLENGGTPTVAAGGTAHKGGDGAYLKFDGVFRGYCAGGGGGTYGSYPVGPGGANGGGSGSYTGHGGKATSYGSGGGGAGGPNTAMYGGGGADGVIMIRYALG